MIGRIWDTATFGAPQAGRRMAALAALGALAGVGETLVVFLIIAMVSGSEFSSVPLGDQLPAGTGALAAVAVAAVAVLAAVHVATARVAARSTAETQAVLQRRIVRAFLAAPWRAQAQAPPGLLQDLATVKAGLLGYAIQQAALAVAALVNLAIVLVAAVVVSPLAALGLLATVVFVLALTRPVRARRLAIIDRYRTSTTDLALELTGTAAVARDVRVFGVEDEAFARLDSAITDSEEETRALQTVSMTTAPLTRDATLMILVVALALIVAGGDVALPALATTVVLLLRVLAHAQSLTSFVTHFDELALNVAALRATLAEWEEHEPRGDRPCSRVERLDLSAATFTYPGRDRPAVSDATLSLSRGEMVGIVGRTGAGKSTLASLILGLLHPTTGEVTADGHRLESLDPADWHARTAWVGQEPRLLTGSVGENIRFLRDGLTDDDVRHAAELAGLGPEIAAWPSGIDHAVGPAGAALSGGERQRVALARALAGKPDVLVLDEPTSALDAQTEEAVRAAIAAVRSHRIVVVIAHRLSTLQACDRIAVVVDGRIEAVAAPEELETGNAYYREALAASRP